MTLNKTHIKEELVKIANNILIEYSEPDFIKTISVMNMADKTTFLGSLKVFDEKNLNPIINELEDNLKIYGELSLRSQKVVSCCAPTYYHVSFNISVS